MFLDLGKMKHYVEQRKRSERAVAGITGEGSPFSGCREMPPDKQFLQTILNSVADGVFTVDSNWRIMSFNRAAERITGVPAADAIGRRCADVFHADICALCVKPWIPARS